MTPQNYRKQEKNGKNGRKARGGRKEAGRDYPDKPIRANAASHVTKGPGLHHAWVVLFFLVATKCLLHFFIGCLNSREEKKVFLRLLLSEPAIFSRKPIAFLEAPPRRAWASISSLPPHPPSLLCHHMPILPARETNAMAISNKQLLLGRGKSD